MEFGYLQAQGIGREGERMLKWLTSRRESGLTPLDIAIVVIILLMLAGIVRPQMAY